MASFKDIYEQDKKKGPAAKAEDIKVDEVELAQVRIGEGLKVDDGLVEVKREMTVLEEQVVRVDLTESIKDVLTEQREQSAAIFESVLKSNTKIANNVAKHVKDATAINEKLVEAILSLAEKIELLEAKLDVIKDLEIPTPIVHVQTPNSRVMKEIHRDTKGLITHITESEERIDPEDE
jgi:type IV secretory pathway VirJ component